MPNIKSAKKRLKQSLKRRDRNRTTKAAMRTSVKKAEKGIETGGAVLQSLQAGGQAVHVCLQGIQGRRTPGIQRLLILQTYQRQAFLGHDG